jgi:outer membrane protein assembly factor BamA
VDATGEPEQATGGHVPVIVTLSPGPVYKFDGVNVTGLRRLRPSYVRNRFASLEGKNYSPDVLDEKFRELMRTGLFNVLQINPQPEAGNYLRLDISAEEAKAKEFGFSVGYGTYVGGIVGLSFADRDLFGYGRPLTTSIEISERGYKGEILWDDPHFFESDVELKVRLSAFTFDFDGYSKFEIGARTEFSYNITKQYQVGVFGSERRVEIVSNDIKDKFIGDTKYFVSSIGLFHTLDLRDSPLVPSRGLILGQTFELAANAIGSEHRIVSHHRARQLLHSGWQNFAGGRRPRRIGSAAGGKHQRHQRDSDRRTFLQRWQHFCAQLRRTRSRAA